MSVSESEYVIPLTVTPADGGYDVNVGSLGEQADWSISLNQPQHASVDSLARGGSFGGVPCRHALNINIQPQYTQAEMERRPGMTNWENVHWVVPRAVNCKTQGGYDATSICLDCILEATAKLPERSQ